MKRRTVLSGQRRSSKLPKMRSNHDGRDRNRNEKSEEGEAGGKEGYKNGSHNGKKRVTMKVLVFDMWKEG